MKKTTTCRNIWLVVLINLCIPYSYILAQAMNEKGSYLSILNFSSRDYKALPQNWSIAQDSRGVMYFANSEGILEYDGVSWKTINMEYRAAKAIAIDTRDGVYAGGEDFFGKLEADNTGKLYFHSFNKSINDSIKIDIWKILVTEEAVFYQSRNYIFQYSNELVKVWYFEKGIQNSFFAGNKLYINLIDEGLHCFTGKNFVLIKGTEEFGRLSVRAMIPRGNKEILLITEDGRFLYFLVTTLKGIIGFKLQAELKEKPGGEYKVNCAVRIDNTKIAFGTEGGGVIVFDENSHGLDKIDHSSSLQDQVVKDIFQDFRGNLWMALSNGISMVPASLPVTFFGYASGLKETIESTCRFQNRIIAATHVGCFQLIKAEKSSQDISNQSGSDTNKSHFRKIAGLNESCFNLLAFQDKGENILLVAAYSGIYQLNPDLSFRKIVTGSPWMLYQSRKYPSRILIANENGVESIYRLNGTWMKEGSVAGIDDDLRSIEEDTDGDAWIGSNKSGIYRLSFPRPGSAKKVHWVKYDTAQGLPANYTHISRQQKFLIFGTENGIYKFLPSQTRFEPDSSFPPEFINGSRGIHRISVEADSNIWIVSYKKAINENETGYLHFEKGHYEWIREPFLSFSKNLLHTIRHDSNGISWLGGPEGLFRFDRNIHKDYHQDYFALIRKVVVGNDSIIFNGLFKDLKGNPIPNQSSDDLIRLEYRLNKISLYFSSLNNEDGSRLEFSEFLEGYDKRWNDWHVENRKEYTNLREGDYIFRLKARNMYGHESSPTRFRFTVLPPWYRTIPAYIAFTIISISLLIMFVAIYTRGLRRIIRLRTAQIMEQKNEIENKNRDIMDSIRYAGRIQKALLPPWDYVDEILPERFIFYLPRDVVSGDFYWLGKMGNKIYSITADCTGHGVPGAMMSMLGMAFLNEFLAKGTHKRPHEVLNEMRAQIIRSMRQTGQKNENQDGMDISLCVIDLSNQMLEFAGANHSLLIFQNEQQVVIKGDKMPLGISDLVKESFTTKSLQLSKGNMLYTFSDGFQDQFGGKDGKKFLAGNLRKLLSTLAHKPLSEQYAIIEETFINWKGPLAQIDDVLVMGIRI